MYNSYGSLEIGCNFVFFCYSKILIKYFDVIAWIIIA